jgi:hypothetical protein
MMDTEDQYKECHLMAADGITYVWHRKICSKIREPP